MMDFKMDGLDELMRELENIGKDMQKNANDAVDKAGDYYQGKVVDRAPRRAGPEGGNLKRHIERTETKDGETTIFVDQQGPAYYGVMVEEGTSKMRAQPYMYPTYQREKNKLISIMADVLRMRLML